MGDARARGADAFANNRGIGRTGGLDSSSLTSTSQSFNLPWRDHTVTAAGTYVAPWALTLAARDSFQSGSWSGPIYRLGTVDPAFGPVTAPLADGTMGGNPLAIPFRFAFPTRGEGQFMLPGIHELNVRIGRDIRFNRSRLNVGLDVFNVANKGAPTTFASGANETYNVNYQKGDRPQPPRSAQISARFSF